MTLTKAKSDCGVCDETYAEARVKSSVFVWRYKYRASVAVSLIRKFGFKRPSVLDMGCADGLTLLEMQNQLQEGDFYGIELSEGLVELARLKGVKAFVGNVCNLSNQFQGCAYDVVTAMAVLEHLPYPELAAKEVFRVLKPGGILIATCPDPKWESISKKLGLFKDETHYSCFDRERFQEFASQFGFRVEVYARFMSAPLGFTPYLRLPLPVKFALIVDRAVHSLRLFDWCFVNQVAVLRKLRHTIA